MTGMSIYLAQVHMPACTHTSTIAEESFVIYLSSSSLSFNFQFRRALFDGEANDLSSLLSLLHVHLHLDSFENFI